MQSHLARISRNHSTSVPCPLVSTSFSLLSFVHKQKQRHLPSHFQFVLVCNAIHDQAHSTSTITRQSHEANDEENKKQNESKITSTTRSRSSRSSSPWKDPGEHRKFFDRIAVDLGVKQPEDWNKIKIRQVRELGGSPLLRLYGDSLVRALKSAYPEHASLLISSHVKAGYWKDEENRRKFFREHLPRELGIRQPEDWYNINVLDVHARGGGGLMQQHFGNSLLRALQWAYPEHEWDPSRFPKAPRGFWRDLQHQRQFFDRLGREVFGVKHLDDWYSVSAEQVRANGGAALLTNLYRNSMLRALRAVYPEHQWDEHRLQRVPRHHWNDLSNQRRLFDRIAQELGISINDPNGWYNVSVEDVRSRGAAGLLMSHYGGSLPRALRAIYPEHPWQSWRFARIPLKVGLATMAADCDNSSCSCSSSSSSRGSDSSAATATTAIATAIATATTATTATTAIATATTVLADCIDTLSKQFSIKHLDDWYRVSVEQLRLLAPQGYFYLMRLGGLAFALKKRYPEHPWDEKRFALAGKKSVQRWVLLAAQKLFPNEEVIEDYLHPRLVFESTKQPMELDVYVPSLSLAFEYQGEQHYRDVSMFHNELAKKQDEEKARACREAGVTLVVVPYWWDRKAESLAEAVREARPELLSTTSTTTSTTTTTTTVQTGGGGPSLDKA